MKTDQDIENMLRSERNLSLSTQEKATIKSTLLEHARETLGHDVRTVPSPWNAWLMRGSVSFASLLLVFLGTAYASQNSLPGEPLYAMKVQVTEEMVALTKITPQDQVAYDIRRLETRLDEIQAVLEQDETVMSEDFAEVSHQIEEHTADITDTLDTTETSVMPHEQKLEVLTKLSGITKAQARVTQSKPELTEISETLAQTHESAADALEATVEDFVDEQSTEVVNEYLSDQITEIGNWVHTSTTDETIQDSAERHLYDVDEALKDGDTSQALISILEAQEAIDVDDYLDNSEGSLDTETETIQEVIGD